MRASLLRLLAIAVAIVAADQWTKLWATRNLAFHEPVEVLGEFVRLTYTRNSGVAFGLGQGFPFPYYLFSIAAILVILLLFLGRRIHGIGREVAMSLILGGALGNLIDRLRTGEVVDFIEIGYGRWHWPVFNLADSAVTVGVVLFALTWGHPPEHEARQPEESVRRDDDANPGAVRPGTEGGRAPGSVPGEQP